MSLRQRVSSGIVFGIVMIASTILNNTTCLLIYILMGILSVKELNNLLFSSKKQYRLVLNLGLHLLLVLFIFLSQVVDKQLFMLYIPIAFVCLFVPELYTKSTKPFTNIAYSCLVLIYIGLPVGTISYVVFFSEIESVRFYILSILLLVWANDVFAYFTGSAIGKTKLFERISPNKTWEGTFGGITGCLGVGALLCYVFSNVYIIGLEEDMVFWFGLAVVSSVSAIFGDLIESLFKRSIGIKDSGHFLPGHGGVLDRFDAFLFAAPLSLFYILFYYQVFSS